MYVDSSTSVVVSFSIYSLMTKRERETDEEGEEEEEKSVARKTEKCCKIVTCSLSRERVRERRDDRFLLPVSSSVVSRLEHYLSSLLSFA